MPVKRCSFRAIALSTKGAVSFRPPAGKSELIRTMLLAAGARDSSCIRPSNPCDDVLATAKALARLGARSSFDGGGIRIEPIARRGPGGEVVVNAGESGALARFLLGISLALPHALVVDAAAGLRGRPMGPLIEAIGGAGAKVDELGRAGCLPVRVRPPIRGFPDRLEVAAGQSSQFVSALLLGAAWQGRGAEVRALGLEGSSGYVELTLRCIERAGLDATRLGRGHYRVGPGRLEHGELEVEGDWSGAANLLAGAAISGGEVTALGLDPDSPQPDRGILDLLRAYGAQVEQGPARRVRVVGRGRLPLDVDLRPSPDLGPLLGVLALLAAGPSRLRGLRSLRLKESDRVAAMAETARLLGGRFELSMGDEEGEGDEPPREEARVWPAAADHCEPRSLLLPSFGDHRVAMAAGVAGLLVPGVQVLDPQVVSKSYPGFWEDLALFAHEVAPGSEERAGSKGDLD